MRWLALPLMLVLGGCDAAISDRPMFTQADAVGAPQFENGVWTALLQDDCEFDANQRVSSWPKCAVWAFHQDGRWYLRKGKEGVETRDMSNWLLFVGGDVAMVQVERSPMEPDEKVSFEFWALGVDPTGPQKLRKIEIWQVRCGLREDVPAEIATTDGSIGEEIMIGRLVRFPGFNDECRPDSVASLRAAALASRPAAMEELVRLEWVRTELD